MKSDVYFSKHCKTLITYDLSDNDISAKEICNHSALLQTTVSIENIGTFHLPNTTIVSTIVSKDEAKKEFENAFAQAKSELHSYAKITKLFVVEIFEKSAVIENN